MDTATSMSDTASSEEMAQLRDLVPLHTLPDEALADLLETATFESIARGKMLFREGDTDHEHVYLLEGTITLLTGKAVVDKIEAGSETARFPLAHQLPRNHSARAVSKVRIARFDSRRLSDALARTQTVDYQVADFEEATEDDWMSMLLQSRILQQVPASNIQRVMMNVEQVEVSQGEDLVRQGDPGDYYYMLTEGRAVVLRDSGDGQGPVELATLGPGDAFGEEALLSDNPRNSTITMLQDGLVLRLSKENFLDLIQNPLLERVNMGAARAKVEQGAIWLDLRNSEQYDESHLPSAINLPFESLRYQTSSLSPDRHYVLYSNSGGRAMAGAFLLAERGFDVSVLDGGIDGAAADVRVVEQAAEAADAGSDEAAAADPELQERIREAEMRAQELEERLRDAERHKEDVEVERQQHLQQVSHAVDQARRKLLETEEQKREAQAAQEKAYAEMDRLTSNLEQVESERASLLDRMSEIEGLDKQLQARLAKAERELIGARERAESATTSLEELSDRIAEIQEQRREEREQHARERGELKEEMTALQMELEQAQLDLEELRESRELQAAEGEDVQQLQQRLADGEGALEALQAERDQLRAELEALSQAGESQADASAAALQAELEQLRAQNAELQAQGSAHSEQTAALREAEQRLEGSRAELLALSGERDQDRQALEAANAQLDELRATLQNSQAEREALRAELTASGDNKDALQQAQSRLAELEQTAQRLTAVRSELDDVRAELAAAQAKAAQQAAAAQQELAQLRSEGEALKAQQAEEAQTAAAALEQAQGRIDELSGRLAEDSRQAAQRLEAKQHELDEAHSELEAVKAEAQQALADEQAQARSATSELEAEIERLRGAQQALAAQAAGQTSVDEQSLQQLRDEASELSQRLADRDVTLQAARAEQAELIESLNVANAECERLQLALSERDDDQARLVDLENQVAEALRTHENELLKHEQVQHRLRDELAEENARRLGLEAEVERISAMLPDEDAEARMGALRDEAERLRGALAEREHELEQLRAAQSADTQAAEIEKLRAELDGVREQATRDLAEMREQLAQSEMQRRRLQQADGREAISHEAMRQEIDELKSSLGERQRELAGAEESRHMLEDSLEDANRQLDDLRRELEKAAVEADEAVMSRREAEVARDQLQQALQRLQEDAEEARVIDLRDERLKPITKPIGIDAVTGPGRWVSGIVGAAAAVAALEAVSLLSGRGELFSELLKLTGP